LEIHPYDFFLIVGFCNRYFLRFLWLFSWSSILLRKYFLSEYVRPTCSIVLGPRLWSDLLFFCWILFSFNCRDTWW
jgi:hypothetical protein